MAGAFKVPGGVAADVIAELTANAGVNVDGLVIKDGRIPASGTTFRGARVIRSTEQTIENATLTGIDWSSAPVNVGPFWVNTELSRLTIPAGMGGLYLVLATARFGGGTTGQRIVQIRANGTTTLAEARVGAAPSGDAITITASRLWFGAAGGYVQMLAFQSNGGQLGVTSGDSGSQMSIIYLGGA